MKEESMTDERLRQALRDGKIPEPVGGHDATRERLLGRVRHQFPPDGAPKKRRTVRRNPSFVRSMGAGLALAAMALTAVVFWPQDSPPADDSLPSDTQMRQFYDAHELHSAQQFGSGSQS